jgi:hypothetical protein
MGMVDQEVGTNKDKPSCRSKSSTPALKISGLAETRRGKGTPPGIARLAHSAGLSDHDPAKAEDSGMDSHSSQTDSSMSDDNCAQLSRNKLMNGPPRNDGPRRQHLAAISAVLHRCLLEGDYFRAGRAWGMLLRSEVDGHPVDIRNKYRWGIGAEILLQRNLPQREYLLNGDQGSIPEKMDETNSANCTSKYNNGSQAAEEYYDRLIVQYPHRKTFPSAVGPLDFYPVLFGLRIFSGQLKDEEFSRALQANDFDNGSIAEEGVKPDPTSTLQEIPYSKRSWMRKLLTSSLNHAKDMASQLDELLISPPYSDDVRLRDIRSMVGMWTEDLLYHPLFSSKVL